MRVSGGVVRISDLSRLSGVSIPTIKFYLREGLLEPGVPTARNQADYDSTHLRRVRMIRTLTSVGALDLASVRRLLAAVDDRRLPVEDLYRAISAVLCPQNGRPAGEGELQPCLDEVGVYLEGLGWGAEAQRREPAVQVLTEVVFALRELGCEADLSVFDGMARLAQALAVVEVEEMPQPGDPDDRGGMVARAVLFDVAFSVLHRMAYHHVAITRSAHARQP
jgi:DNA-binding transcriptional MerR regulator